MKKQILLSFLFCAGTLLGGKVYAMPMLTLTASDNHINSFGVVAIDIGVTGLGNNSAPSLGAFSLDLVYSSNVLRPIFNPVFGTYLGDEGVGEAVTYSDATFQSIPAGLEGVYLDEVSFLFDFELDTLQPDSFNLATVFFQGIADGFGFVGYENAVLSDAFGGVIAAPVRGGGMLIEVPEPGTLVLFGAALAGMFLARRREQTHFRGLCIES